MSDITKQNANNAISSALALFERRHQYNEDKVIRYDLYQNKYALDCLVLIILGENPDSAWVKAIYTELKEMTKAYEKQIRVFKKRRLFQFRNEKRCTMTGLYQLREALRRYGRNYYANRESGK